MFATHIFKVSHNTSQKKHACIARNQVATNLTPSNHAKECEALLLENTDVAVPSNPGSLLTAVTAVAYPPAPTAEASGQRRLAAPFQVDAAPVAAARQNAA